MNSNKKRAHVQEWHSLTEKTILNQTKTVSKLLKIRTIKRKEHFLFNLLCFLYFRRSAARSLETRHVGTFFIIPYVFFAEVYFFRSPRYFVTVDQQIVGLVALQERTDTIFISVLATHPFYRRMGIASFMLDYAGKLAMKLGKTSLELTVLKVNKPALKLYNNFGFHLKEEKRRSYVLQYHF
jgi:ribosomal protein S18 acetylase RimI-like enzyme